MHPYYSFLKTFYGRRITREDFRRLYESLWYISAAQYHERNGRLTEAPFREFRNAAGEKAFQCKSELEVLEEHLNQLVMISQKIHEDTLNRKSVPNRSDISLGFNAIMLHLIDSEPDLVNTYIEGLEKPGVRDDIALLIGCSAEYVTSIDFQTIPGSFD